VVWKCKYRHNALKGGVRAKAHILNNSSSDSSTNSSCSESLERVPSSTDTTTSSGGGNSIPLSPTDSNPHPPFTTPTTATAPTTKTTVPAPILTREVRAQDAFEYLAGYSKAAPIPGRYPLLLTSAALAPGRI
jgi:hypothetical protein